MPPACTVDFGLVETARQHAKEVWGGAPFPPWHSSLSECGGWLSSHPTVVWALLDLRFEQGRYLGPMDGSKTVLTIKRPPPGERWKFSLFDKAHGFESAPNALEDDGGRVGSRAPVLQPHAAVLLPPSAPEFRHVRRAPLRRPDFEQFDYTDSCPGCATQELVVNKRLTIHNSAVPAWRQSW